MPTYKTKDGNDYVLPGIGRTVEGRITTSQVIENVKFIEVTENDAQPAAVAPNPVQVAAVPQPVPPSAIQQTVTIPQNQEGNK